MTQQIINIGATANDGLGDPIRTAYNKCNENFTELYARVQDTAPTVNTGSTGDVAGMIAYDSTYLYVCIADFDGSTAIWGRILLDTSW
jgi:hypothetical protein